MEGINLRKLGNKEKTILLKCQNKIHLWLKGIRLDLSTKKLLKIKKKVKLKMKFPLKNLKNKMTHKLEINHLSYRKKLDEKLLKKRLMNFSQDPARYMRVTFQNQQSQVTDLTSKKITSMKIEINNLIDSIYNVIR